MGSCVSLLKPNNQNLVFRFDGNDDYVEHSKIVGKKFHESKLSEEIVQLYDTLSNDSQIWLLLGFIREAIFEQMIPLDVMSLLMQYIIGKECKNEHSIIYGKPSEMGCVPLLPMSHSEIHKQSTFCWLSTDNLLQINCVLQCLMHTPLLRQHLQSLMFYGRSIHSENFKNILNEILFFMFNFYSNEFQCLNGTQIVLSFMKERHSLSFNLREFQALWMLKHLFHYIPRFCLISCLSMNVALNTTLQVDIINFCSESKDLKKKYERYFFEMKKTHSLFDLQNNIRNIFNTDIKHYEQIQLLSKCGAGEWYESCAGWKAIRKSQKNMCCSFLFNYGHIWQCTILNADIFDDMLIMDGTIRRQPHLMYAMHCEPECNVLSENENAEVGDPKMFKKAPYFGHPFLVAFDKLSFVTFAHLVHEICLRLEQLLNISLLPSSMTASKSKNKQINDNLDSGCNCAQFAWIDICSKLPFNLYFVNKFNHKQKCNMRHKYDQILLHTKKAVIIEWTDVQLLNSLQNMFSCVNEEIELQQDICYTMDEIINSSKIEISEEMFPPQILIIHFQRNFIYDDEKGSAFEVKNKVIFPLNEWSPTNLFNFKSEKKQLKYDLYGVCTGAETGEAYVRNLCNIHQWHWVTGKYANIRVVNNFGEEIESESIFNSNICFLFYSLND